MRLRLRTYMALAVLALTGCTADSVEELDHGYPTGIGEILEVRCTTSGCHNSTSAAGAAGLDLSTWDKLFLGSRGGSAVVPFSPEQSYLLFSVNTDTALGPTLYPTMPLNGTHLTADEYTRLVQWITDGARNARGEVKFPDISTRRKWYITNQGCDLVAVMDAASGQIMRYVQVGQLPIAEQPHNVKISKDGAYWYTVFLTQNPHLEKYSTLTDQKVADITIGNGNWNTFNISPDGKFGLAVSYKPTLGPGETNVSLVSLVNDVVTEAIRIDDPVHGSAPHPTLPRWYVTKQDGSELVMIEHDASGHVQNIEPIDLVQGTPPQNGVSTLKPHEVIFSPAGDRYFVTCQFAKEVRAYDATTNALLGVVQVGDDPVEMAIDAGTGHLFVTCMEDVSSWGGDPSRHGSVAVIDYNTISLVRTIYTGYQPHGIAVDAAGGVVLVANRNVNANGPAPHHTAACGGRNGYLTLIDLQTLELRAGYKPELASDPYAVAVKR